MNKKRPNLGNSEPSSPVTLSEARADWAPLWKAPFFFLSDGRMHTAMSWPDAFSEDVRKLTSERPEWSVTTLGDGHVLIHAMGICTDMAPGFIAVSATTGGWLLSNWRGDLAGIPDWAPASDKDRALLHSNWHANFLNIPDWDRDIPASDEEGAFFHKVMITELLGRLTSNFANAIKSGTARLMARRSSVFAPFEHIAWDQWQYFALGNEDEEEIRDFMSRLPAAAVTLAGERIYSIHVAPGDHRDESTEEKCLRRLKQFIRDNPDRCPVPAEDLAKEMASEFSGLSKKTIRYCIARAAAAEAGNRAKGKEWLRRGRPKILSVISPK
jgi:hypothetical protein